MENTHKEHHLKRRLRDYLALFLISGSIVALDQWTKTLVRENIPLGGIWMPWEWLQPYARIVHWYNTGAAFGLFKDGNLVFSILAIVVSIFIIYYFPRVLASDRMLRLALAMQLGGAVGNLVDRLTVGKVTDFISLGNFPVFNVADSSITVGVAVLALGAWLKERADRRKQIIEPPPVEGETPGG